ncbi:unnamed protein product [marine sediment metagenome]|uniref:Uncharacterized protein n=1 Tax=marine sediment metagenome TaxID=412755 RepID=X1H0D9_9ZZZZ
MNLGERTPRDLKKLRIYLLLYGTRSLEDLKNLRKRGENQDGK